jgi:hypothetical protein
MSIETLDQVRAAVLNLQAIEAQYTGEKNRSGTFVACPLMIGSLGSSVNKRVLCYHLCGDGIDLEAQSAGGDKKYLLARMDDLKVLNVLHEWYCPRTFRYDYWANDRFASIEPCDDILAELKESLNARDRLLFGLTSNGKDFFNRADVDRCRSRKQ